MTKKILLAVAALVGLTASAHALDANCTNTAALSIIKCPEDSIDWYDSYTDIVDTLDAVGSSVTASTNSFQTQLNAVGVSTTNVAVATTALAAVDATIGASTKTLAVAVGASTASLQTQLNAVGVSTTNIAASTTTLGASVVTLGASTQTLAVAVGASTAALQVQLNSVGTSTTAIAAATTTLDAANLDTATFGVYSGTVTTAIAAKLDAATFGLYGGTVTTALATKLDAATFGLYGGTVTTALATKLDASVFGAYGATVTTALATKLDAATFGVYGGTVTTALALKTDNVTFGAYGSTVATAFENVRLATTSLAVGVSTVYWTATHLSTANFSSGFNAANQLVQLDGTARLPAVDGSQLTGLAGVLSGGLVGAVPVWTAATSLGNSAFTHGTSSVTLSISHQAVLMSSLTGRGLATFNTSGSTQATFGGFSGYVAPHASNGRISLGLTDSVAAYIDHDGNSNGRTRIGNMWNAGQVILVSRVGSVDYNAVQAQNAGVSILPSGSPAATPFSVGPSSMVLSSNGSLSIVGASLSTQVVISGWSHDGPAGGSTSGMMKFGTSGTVGLRLQSSNAGPVFIEDMANSGINLCVNSSNVAGTGRVCPLALEASGPISISSITKFRNVLSTQAWFYGSSAVGGKSDQNGSLQLGGLTYANGRIDFNSTGTDTLTIDNTSDQSSADIDFGLRTEGTRFKMMRLQADASTPVSTMTVMGNGRVNIGGSAEVSSEARAWFYSASEPQLRVGGWTKIGGAHASAGSLMFGGEPLARSRIEYDNANGSGLGSGSMVFSNEYGGTDSKFMFRTASEANPTLASTMTYTNGILNIQAPNRLGAGGGDAGGWIVVSGSMSVTQLSAGCGAAASFAAGSGNSRGRITVQNTGATTCILTFSSTAPNSRAPACAVNNETTANLARATPTSTQVTFAGTTVAGDVLSYVCEGM